MKGKLLDAVTPPLPAVQDVNSLLAEPERVHKIDPVDARTLIIQLASLLILLSTRASEPSQPIAVSSDPATWLSAEQVEQRFGLPNTWLHEHRRQLSSLGIVSRPSRKTTLYDVKKLGRFIESRRQSATTNDHVALNR